MIRNFIWEGKLGARVRQGVLQLEYEKGGLQLVDINCKIKVQRAKRILYLMSLDSNHVERVLADNLVGISMAHKQQGLSYGLLNNLVRIKLIKNDFYKNALEIVSNLNLIMRPANIKTIANEPLFYNKFFIDPSTNCPFKLTRFKKQLSNNVKELQTSPHSHEQEVNDTVT